MLTVLHCVYPQILTDDNSALISTDFFQSADYYRLRCAPKICVNPNLNSSVLICDPNLCGSKHDAKVQNIFQSTKHFFKYFRHK